MITAGGIHGSVREIVDDLVHLEIAPGVVVEVDRRAIAAVAREVEVEVEPEPEAEPDPTPSPSRTNLPAERPRNQANLPARVVSALQSDPDRPDRPRARRRGVPGRPRLARGHRGVKKGLDLQGGLEVVLKAQPPKGHKLTSSDLDRSVSIMRSRVDKLGVASPEIRKQGTNQIVIQLAGVHDPAQAAAIIGTTAQLELYDLEVALVPPSITASGSQPVAFRNLYNLLSRVESTAKVGTPTGYVLFKPVKVKTTTGILKNKKTKTTTVWVKKAGPIATLHRDPSTGNEGLLDAHKGKIPAGWKVLAVPARTVVITCSQPGAVVCPGDTPGRAAGRA